MTSFGSNGSQIPEDYLENGSLWEHLGRGGITFRNYGEGYELPHNDEGDPDSKTGANMLINFPMPKILFDNTCLSSLRTTTTSRTSPAQTGLWMM